MASASSSAQAAFGLGRRKKNPGLLDQIGKFFGGDKKRKGKGSFRGALSPGPQKASATSPRKRGAENAVVHFFLTRSVYLIGTVSLAEVGINLLAVIRHKRFKRQEQATVL
uniref:Myelin basic protein n=1 Tax=Oreochromis aureus TaxID=47969 RepID=A0AAZ1XJL6_OREAU